MKGFKCEKMDGKFYFIENKVFMPTHALNKYMMQGFSNGLYVFINILFFNCDRGGYTLHEALCMFRKTKDWHDSFPNLKDWWDTI